jgi:hypothetical protein
LLYDALRGEQFYANNIRTYLTNLMKLQNEGTAKGDVIGAEVQR